MEFLEPERRDDIAVWVFSSLLSGNEYDDPLQSFDLLDGPLTRRYGSGLGRGGWQRCDCPSRSIGHDASATALLSEQVAPRPCRDSPAVGNARDSASHSPRVRLRDQV